MESLNKKSSVSAKHKRPSTDGTYKTERDEKQRKRDIGRKRKKKRKKVKE